MGAEYIKYLDKTMKYLHKQGAFLTTKDGERINTMTISWGNMGFEWGRPTFTIFVRKSRYTHEILRNSNEFTISIPLDPRMKKALGICGSKSGRDLDKFKLAGIETKKSNSIETPVIDGCQIFYECKIIYKHDLTTDMLNEDIKKSTYIEGDYHTVYYGEIIDCYTEEK